MNQPELLLNTNIIKAVSLIVTVFNITGLDFSKSAPSTQDRLSFNFVLLHRSSYTMVSLHTLIQLMWLVSKSFQNSFPWISLFELYCKTGVEWTFALELRLSEWKSCQRGAVRSDLYLWATDTENFISLWTHGWVCLTRCKRGHSEESVNQHWQSVMDLCKKDWLKTQTGGQQTDNCYLTTHH